LIHFYKRAYKMSGYPGAPPSAYPGAPSAGYPGAPPAGYPQPGAPQAGYPGAPQPGAPAGYPGAPPAGYPGAPQAGYPGAQQPGAPPSGYPGAPQQGYPASAPGATPPVGYPGAPQPAYPGAPQQQAYAPIQAYHSSQQQIDPQVAEWFNAVDTDGSGQIDAKELKQALVNGDWTQFSEDACRMMIDMYDQRKCGQININDFGALFAFMNKWKASFESLDQDKTGVLNDAEFTQALQQQGYRFSPTFVNNMLAKYSPRERKLTLDNFIVASVQIKRLTESFRTRDTQMNGQATMGYEDFVGIAMGAHK